MSAELHCRAFVVQHPRSSRVGNIHHSGDSITGRNWLGCLRQLTADPPEETGDSMGFRNRVGRLPLCNRNRVGCHLLCSRRCCSLCDLSRGVPPSYPRQGCQAGSSMPALMRSVVEPERTRKATLWTLLFFVAQRIDFRGIQPAVQDERIVGCQGEPCVQLPRRLAERVEVQDGLNRAPTHCHAQNLSLTIH